MRSLLRARGGFTIVELIGAVTLSLILAGGFYAALYGVRNEIYQQRMYFDTNKSIRYAEDRLTRDIREAIEVTPTYGAYTTGDSTLILKLPSIDSSGDATDVSSQFDYVTWRYDSANQKLLRSLDVLGGTSQREGGADRTDKQIATRVTAVSFTNGGTGLGSLTSAQKLALEYVNVAITAQGTTLGNNQTTSIDSDVTLRNKV